ncbi:hypothetical protein [Stagnimonas aquatica]|nr:hypothetical protein [Stagnimonas aquatica]
MKKKSLQDISAEDAFLMFGYALLDPPPLFEWKSELGVSARSAAEQLLASIEANDVDASLIAQILACCAYPMDQWPLDLLQISLLTDGSWSRVLRVLELVRKTQGLRPNDFHDGGARFQRCIALGFAPPSKDSSTRQKASAC